MPYIDTELIAGLFIIALIGALISLLSIYIHRKYLPNGKAIIKLLKNKWFLSIISLILIFLIYAFFLTPGNVQYYKKWHECGRAPVVTQMHGLFGVGAYYYTDSDELYPFRYNPSKGADYYFCSPHDAELRGYSANENQYEYRHSTAEERVEYKKNHSDSILY